jgi:hypothetical protein
LVHIARAHIAKCKLRLCKPAVDIGSPQLDPIRVTVVRHAILQRVVALGLDINSIGVHVGDSNAP